LVVSDYDIFPEHQKFLFDLVGNGNSEKNKRCCCDALEMIRFSQLLFGARDGREVFTPFLNFLQLLK
jgi:hypothetical protein